MLDVLARNEYGFSINFKNNIKFDIIDIKGLNPTNATINSSSIPNYSGSIYNSAYIGNRNIVLSIVCNSYDDKARKELNNVFIPSKQLILEIGNYSIEGYVESTEYNPFDNKIITQVSIICLYPYFSAKDENVIKISNISNLFEFPIDLPPYGVEFGEIHEDTMANIVLIGDVGTGCIIEAYFNSQIDGLKINNITHNQSMFIDRIFYNGQKLTIDTRFYKKSIILTLENNTTLNIISNLDITDTNIAWIELEPGDNNVIFTDGYDNTLENTDIYIKFSDKIGGI